MNDGFYAIAAQVIPTLLIAIALEGGVRSNSTTGDITLPIVGMVSLGAEYICLRILMDSIRSTELWQTIVFFGVMILVIFAVSPLLIARFFRLNPRP